MRWFYFEAQAFRRQKRNISQSRRVLLRHSSKPAGWAAWMPRNNSGESTSAIWPQGGRRRGEGGAQGFKLGGLPPDWYQVSNPSGSICADCARGYESARMSR